MKTKQDFIDEIDFKFNSIRETIIQLSANITNENELTHFYNKTMEQFYDFMPYYSFHIYSKSTLSYSSQLELNQHGADRSKELHQIYTQLFHEKNNQLMDIE